VLINLHLVKKNKENRDNTPSKSGIKDALVIADMVKNGYYTFIKETFFMATMALIMNDISFKRQHEVNVKMKNMNPMRSVMKLCGELARLLVAMAHSGDAYEPDRAHSIKQTA
jgi:hypothetical protein